MQYGEGAGFELTAQINDDIIIEAIKADFGIWRKFMEKQIEYIIRPFKQGEENYAADLHRRLYSEEYGWGDEFIKYAEKIPVEFAAKEKSDREELFIAESGGKPVGCIMLCDADEPDVGQLRLFAVEKEYRQCGIGKALTDALMDKVDVSGYKKLILWTASLLTTAIGKYEKIGFRTVETVENTTWRVDGGTVYEVKMEMYLE